MRHTPSIQAKISATVLVLGVALGIAPLALAGQQSEPTTQSPGVDGMTVMAVKGDKTPLRSGDQDVFYAIGELSADTVLRVRGVSGSFTMVMLPEKIGAFVPVGEVQGGAVDGSITLRIDSGLRAPSMLLGLPGSWKAAYTTALPAGTTLKVIETIKSARGETLGYRVVAPKGPLGEVPVGYVKTAALREPTAQELGSLAGAGKDSAKAEPAEKAPNVTSGEDQADESVDTSLMEEMVTDEPALEPASDSASDSGSEPATVPMIEITNSTPVDIDPEPSVIRAKSGRVSTSALEDLEAAFDSARSLSRADLDAALDELHAEFTRTRVDAEDGSSLSRALDQRLEWLSIRIESRDQRRAISAALAANDEKLAQVEDAIKAWQSGRAYQLVGRMVPSTVYTGDHLALLYRIERVDPSTGASRTIGYVAPRSDQDFRHLLGRVVGVIGSTTDDLSLKLTVIEPDRVDPMPE